MTQPTTIISQSLSPEMNTEGPNDSGCNSQTTTPGGGNSNDKNAQTGHSQRLSSISFSLRLLLNRKEFQHFPNIEISEASRRRFRVIQPHFEKLLLDHIRAKQRANEEYKPMSTRLMMMGYSQDAASAHIVVFCQSEQKAMVQKFVKNDCVKDLCETSDVGIPSFPVTVSDNAPRL